MRYLSLFSGIEAASAAWAPLGWECVGVSEIEPFPCAVLAQRHPGVPNLGDITKITESDIALLGGIDLVVFGSPCQDLSVAGKRKGLDGEPVCETCDSHYADCDCPGPTQGDEFEYREVDGVMEARRLPE